MDIAILFLVFNRPELTARVFASIRDARPSRLYIAADGPRASRINENELCNLVRYISTRIDWPCEVKTLFQDRNMGCMRAVSSGIDWFFKHEKEGIILEDDVVPVPSFFTFCHEMLKKYKDDDRVGMIAGSNLISNELKSSDYFFSEIYSIWGWATWRRVWQSYKVELDDWPNAQKEYYLMNRFNAKLGRYFIDNFNNIKAGRIDTWDHQWAYNCIFNSKLCLTPSVNLVSNIGVDGTHSNQLSENHYRQCGEYVSVPWMHPKEVLTDYSWQNNFIEKKIKVESIIVSIIKLLLKNLGLFLVFKNIYKKVI